MEQTFQQALLNRFREIEKQANGTIAQLTYEEMQWTSSEATNSIIILMKHISGNILSRSTDFLTTDGEKISRNRDGEFSHHLPTEDNLIANWQKSWSLLYTTIENLSTEDFHKTVVLKGQEITVIDALLRQLVHYSGHIAQMMHIGKEIKGAAWQTLSIPKKK